MKLTMKKQLKIKGKNKKVSKKAYFYNEDSKEVNDKEESKGENVNNDVEMKDI